MQNGLHLFGSAETVANKIIALKEMGVGHVMTLQNFGMLSQQHVQASMEKLIKDVMPVVNSQSAKKRAVA
jgi:metal-dependent hydrolase (beta-lactamase superfamily II)